MAKKSLNKNTAHLQTLVKRANQRLRQLEKSGIKNSSAYKHIEVLARSGSQLYTRDKQGRIKFRTDIAHLNKSQLSNMQNVVERFLSRKTSTVRGVKEVNYKAYETFINNHPDINITYNDYQLLWTSKIFQSKAGIWSSDVVIDVVTDMLNSEKFDGVGDVLDFMNANPEQDPVFFQDISYYSDNPWEDTNV